MEGQTETTHYSDLTDIATFDTDEGGGVSRSYVAALPQRSTSTDLVDGLIRSSISLPNQPAIEDALATSGVGDLLGPQGGTIDPAGLIQERADGTSTYPLPDAHGDLTATTSQAGSVHSRKTFDPWGTQTSGTRGELGYLGSYLRRTDLDTGLIGMGARQYDPSVSRFTSKDQVLGYRHLGQSWNRGSYTLNNPLIYYDLDGRWFCSKFVDECLKPATNTVGNMVQPWKWDDLSEDVQEGWTHEPYASIADSMRSFLGKDFSIQQCLRNLIPWSDEQGCLYGTGFERFIHKVARAVDRLARDPASWFVWPPR